MLFTDIDILDENLDYQAHQWVGVKDGTIDYIGDAAPENAADYGETYDGRGRLLMPALYNAHTHLPMTLLRGYAENVPLQEWLNNLVWPFEGKMTPDDNYWAIQARPRRDGALRLGQRVGHVLCHRRARAGGGRGPYEDERLRERALLRAEAVC